MYWVKRRPIDVFGPDTILSNLIREENIMRCYRVNGWNEDLDQNTGEWCYTCPDCGCREGDEHGKECDRYNAFLAKNVKRELRFFTKNEDL